MDNEKYKMVIMGMSTSLILNNDFSEKRLQEVLDQAFDGNIKHENFFDTIEQIEQICKATIMEIRNT